MQVVYCLCVTHQQGTSQSALRIPKSPTPSPGPGGAACGLELPVLTAVHGRPCSAVASCHPCQFCSWHYEISPPAGARATGSRSPFPFPCPGQCPANWTVSKCLLGEWVNDKLASEGVTGPVSPAALSSLRWDCPFMEVKEPLYCQGHWSSEFITLLQPGLQGPARRRPS